MTPPIIASIKVKLTETKFNDGCKMYRRLKELLQPKSETQFMQLMREYYTLAYKNFANIPEFLDHIKLLEKQIDAAKVTMTENKQTLLCLTMAPFDLTHLRCIVQIWRITSNMTKEKARGLLLEEERRNSATMIGDYSESVTALARRSHRRGQEDG